MSNIGNEIGDMVGGQLEGWIRMGKDERTGVRIGGEVFKGVEEVLKEIKKGKGSSTTEVIFFCFYMYL